MQQQQLLNASINGDRDAAVRLIAQGTDVNTRDDDYGETALMLAAINGHPEVAEVLIAKGADVHAKCMRHGATALMIAADRKTAELLIANGADINARAMNVGTALIFAIHNGHKEVAELLIAKGAEVNARMELNTTALMMASLKGYRDLAELLIVHGADVNAEGAEGRTVLSVALDAEMVELLKKHGARGMRAAPTSAVIERLRDARESLGIRLEAVGALVERTQDLDQVVRALSDVIGDESSPAGLYIAAVGMLGKVGPPAKSAVPVLIDQIPKARLPSRWALLENGMRVGAAVTSALHDITGQAFGEDQARWQKWWNEQQVAKP